LKSRKSSDALQLTRQQFADPESHFGFQYGGGDLPGGDCREGFECSDCIIEIAGPDLVHSNQPKAPDMTVGVADSNRNFQCALHRALGSG
jgi:hypothetical protein